MAPSVQRRKVWLTPTTRVSCSNVAKTPNPLNFAGVPKLTKRSQPLVGRSSPYYGDMWRIYCCLTSFFSDCRYMPYLRRYRPTKMGKNIMVPLLHRAAIMNHVCLYFQTQSVTALWSALISVPLRVWLSWPDRQVTHRGGLPARRRSPIPVLTGPGARRRVTS